MPTWVRMIPPYSDTETAAVHPERQGTVAGFGGIFGRDCSGIGRIAALPLPSPGPMLAPITKIIGAKLRLLTV